MDLCISELEEVSREPQLNETPQPVVQESPHPYPDDVTLSNTVRMPNAEALVITFDSRYVTFDPRYCGITEANLSLYIYKLREWPF